MSKNAANVAHEHRLTIAEVLGLLVNDGLVEKADAEALVAESRLKRLVVHPLGVIAEQKWKSLQPPHRPLDLEALGEFRIHMNILTFISPAFNPLQQIIAWVLFDAHIQ